MATLVLELTDAQGLSPEAAVSEASGLSKDQALTLLMLYGDGLRASHLRAIGNHITFDQANRDRLRKMIREEGLPPSEGLNRLQGLSEQRNHRLS